MNRLFIALLLATLAAACRPPAQEDLLPPGVEIQSPVGASYRVGDSVRIAIAFSENDALHLIGYKLIERDSLRLVREQVVHVHASSYVMHDVFVSDALYAQRFILVATADDHHGNRAESRFDFEVLP
ncbi:MAG: hypothetical protein OHK0039_12880 [Bacteroidia bacterium]